MKIITTAFFLLMCNIASSQTQSEIDVIVKNSVHPLRSIEETKLTELIQLAKGLDTSAVVGMGEGTHGTAEFIDVRAHLSKILITEKGFKTIFIESPFGDTYEFDRQLIGTKNIDSLMKKHLLSIYQTEEYKSFFEWLRKYNLNRSEEKRIKVVGVDFALINVTARILKAQLKSHTIFNNLADTILRQTAFQDSIWINMNRKEFKYNMKDVIINGFYMVNNIHILKKLADDQNIELSVLVKNCLMNIEHGGEPFYVPQLKKSPRSRDELMAEITNEALKANSSPAIIWAHNAHIAYAPVKGGAGGMGGLIKKKHPSYFSLATGTAFGEYNATLDRFNNNNNHFKSYSINKPIDGSWESTFGKLEYPLFYVDFDRLKNRSFDANLKLRLIGYGLQTSGDGDYTKLPIGELFDGLIFIKTTRSAQMLTRN